jgi:hypothetical protein
MNDHVIYPKFAIAKKLNNQIILGMPWCKLANPILDFQKNKISINKVKASQIPKNLRHLSSFLEKKLKLHKHLIYHCRPSLSADIPQRYARICPIPI